MSFTEKPSVEMLESRHEKENDPIKGLEHVGEIADRPSVWGKGHRKLYLCCALVYLCSTMNGTPPSPSNLSISNKTIRIRWLFNGIHKCHSGIPCLLQSRRERNSKYRPRILDISNWTNGWCFVYLDLWLEGKEGTDFWRVSRGCGIEYYHCCGS